MGETGAMPPAPGRTRGGGRWRRLVPTGVELGLGVGLALYFAWVDCMFYGARLIDIGETPYPGLAANTGVYYISIFTLCATLLVIAMRHRMAADLLFRSGAFVVAPLGMCVSTLCLFLAALDGAVGFVGILLAGVLSGVFSAACLMQWGESLR